MLRDRWDIQWESMAMNIDMNSSISVYICRLVAVKRNIVRILLGFGRY